jgi:predicted TIM-barrel fold metal-dependent hydrolase
MEIVWRLAVELDVPVLSESGALPYRHHAAWGHADHFAEVLRSYPALRLQLAHLGRGAEDAMARIVRLSDTVVTDLAMCLDGLGETLDPEAVCATIRAIGTDRVVYGTNYPMRDEVACAAAFRSLPLSEDELREIGYDNASGFWSAPTWRTGQREQMSGSAIVRPEKR